MYIHTCDIFCVSLEKNVLLFVSQRYNNIIKILVKHTPGLAFQFLLLKNVLYVRDEYWHLVHDAISMILCHLCLFL